MAVALDEDDWLTHVLAALHVEHPSYENGTPFEPHLVDLGDPVSR